MAAPLKKHTTSSTKTKARPAKAGRRPTTIDYEKAAEICTAAILEEIDSGKPISWTRRA